MKTWKKLLTLSVCLCVLPVGAAVAQQSPEEEELAEKNTLERELVEAEDMKGLDPDSEMGDLAKKSQNPVGSLISLPLQNNTNFGSGPGDDVQNILNIQPVLPVSLSEKWNLINRAILPVIYQPEVVPGQGSTTGLGDTSYTAFISPREPGKLIWGVGPVINLPTSTDDALGSGEWAAGPSVVLLTMPGSWVTGILLSNTWSFDGGSDINLFFSQIFANYNMKKGWFLTSQPVFTANWNAASGEEWTVPIGGGVGRVYKIGKQPVNTLVQAYYNIEKPTFGADWQLRIQFSFLFPK